MEKVRYTISDAAQMMDVESHALRYWEEELDLTIPRNEMGHRYYTRENIQEFQKIKELKEKGHRTVQGRCPRNYFMKAYGLDEVETDDGLDKP